MRPMRLVVVLCLVACSGPGGKRPVALVEPAPLTRGEADVILRGSADLDGDGRSEEITLRSTRAKVGQGDDTGGRITAPIVECGGADPCPLTLTAGSAMHKMEVPVGYFGGVGVSVIDVDPATAGMELLVTTRAFGEGEDPGFVFTVLIHDGTTLHAQELWHSGGYNSGDATPGGGALVLRYQDCPDWTTVTYRREGTRMVEMDRKIERKNDPGECAACPFVYVLQDGELVNRGEILRNVNGKDLEQTQSLSIGAARGRIVVELREEKDEVTFLDDVWLEVDGVRVAPSESGAFRGADGSYHVLGRGDVLRLTFEASGDARLFATGYYVANKQ